MSNCKLTLRHLDTGHEFKYQLGHKDFNIKVFHPEVMEMVPLPLDVVMSFPEKIKDIPVCFNDSVHRILEVDCSVEQADNE